MNVDSEEHKNWRKQDLLLLFRDKLNHFTSQYSTRGVCSNSCLSSPLIFSKLSGRARNTTW